MIDTVSYLNSIANSSKTTSSTSSASTTEMDKNAFMQLLINQMANQDPLEPMDNSEFVSQLAQFSSLEQMQNIASAVQMQALSQAASTNSQMVNLIGKHIIAEGNSFSIDGTEAQSTDLKFNLDDKNSIPKEIVVYDSNGKAVRHVNISSIDAGMNTVTFDGKDDSGNSLSSGLYTYKVVDSQGKELSNVTTYSNLLVESVAFNGSSVQVKSNGLVIEVEDITEVLK